MKKLEQLYEGKAKKVYRTDNPDYYWVEYKDDATALNGLKKGTIANKGSLNNRISAYFFRMLAQNGIDSHFVEEKSDTEMAVKALQIILVEVVVRNIAAGSLAKRLGLEEGIPMRNTVVEYYYKSDELGDPLINDDHIRAINLATPEQMAKIKEISLKVNDVLRNHLAERDIELVDFKLEFGLHKGELLLGDEISPDTCRFWDKHTREKLDKDRFRRDLGNVEEAYQEVYRRLTK
ncbi:phosphoribosylaminoimidazolesuccinocarboxamide synthase [Desulfoscipio sp. XC116]|uniref:phosphoribosylaminoimidazolesuccinocarboxamide synthase n=1 Tax=Desulfoscipio sp. XC116 TaxID=3144975 RepID=UPI00325ACF4A